MIRDMMRCPNGPVLYESEKFKLKVFSLFDLCQFFRIFVADFQAEVERNLRTSFVSLELKHSFIAPNPYHERSL